MTNAEYKQRQEEIVTRPKDEQRESVDQKTIDKFWASVDKVGSCWVWTKSKSRGYGQFYQTTPIKKKWLAHRFSLMLAGKLIPDLTADHLCRNRGCVNPDHLEMVTSGENVLRGVGATAVNKRKTHCIQGHEFTEDNTYTNPGGKRRCITCHTKMHKAYLRSDKYKAYAAAAYRKRKSASIRAIVEGDKGSGATETPNPERRDNASGGL